MESKHQKLIPSQAFAHPLWWIALAVLVLNDHFLKGGFVSGAITGKLSDFAGLIVAPVLLAALMRVKTRQGLWSAGMATGLVFAAINLSPACAQLWDRAVSLLVPFHTTTDPTDLIALIAIPLGILIFLPLMTSGKALGKPAKLLAVTVGGMACMATSPEPECFDCEWQDQFSSKVSILNQSDELHVVRIRPLLQDISFDCDAVADNPTAYLLDSYFGPATRWLVQSGQEIPVIMEQRWDEPQEAPCNAAKIESDTLPNILVLWDSSSRTKTYMFDAEIPKNIPANSNTLVIEAEYGAESLHKYLERGSCGSTLDFCDEANYADLATIPRGAQYSWKAVSEERLHWPLPILDSPSTRPGKACEMPGPGEGVYWGEGPNGFDHVIENTILSDDGCAELQLASGQSWYVCGPRFALEPLVPDQTPLRIEISILNQANSGFRGGLEALRIDVLSDTNSIEKSVILSRGFSIPAGAGVTFEGSWDPDCRPIEDICGSLVLPADITLSGLDAPFGEIVEFPNGKGSAMVVRAFNQPVQDPNCEILSSMLPELSLTEDAIFIELAVVLN